MSSSKHAWWQIVQTTTYPTYVTCIAPKNFAPNPKKDKQRVQELAVDDGLDENTDPDNWQPATYTVKAGTCTLALPEDADSAGKSTVSQPYMARISAIYFQVATDDKGKRMGTQELQTADDGTAVNKDVRKWEKKQLQDNRLAAPHFQLEMNYFYRIADFKGQDALDAKGYGAQNNKTLCRALTTLGVVDSIRAAEQLISERKSGQSKASRLLNRFVVFSTHMGSVSHEDADADPSAELDTPLPLESVIGTAKVWYLGAKASLPYMHAPVAPAVELALQRELPVRRRAVLQAELQEQHQELPAGFFCNLIYSRQTGQLLTLEGWATGTELANVKGDWVQPSRRQAKGMLEQSSQQLKALQKQSQQHADSAGTDEPADEQAAAAAAAAGTPAELLDSDLEHDEASQPQHGNKPAAAAARQQQQQQQQQKRTPRKSQHPRRAEPQPQEQQQPQRKRLRTMAEAAGQKADADADAGSGDESDVVMISSDDSSEQEGGSEQDLEAADAAPQRKKQRTAAAATAAAAAAGIAVSDDSEDDSAAASAGGSAGSDTGTSSEDDVDVHAPRSGSEGGSEEEAARLLQGLEEGDSENDDRQEKAAAAGAGTADKRKAASGRGAAAAEAPGGRQQTPHVRSSKAAVLGRRT